MPAETVKPTATAVRWPVPLALAIPALGPGIAVAFSSDHSARYGLVVLAVFALLTAAASVLGATMLPKGTPRLGAILKAVVGVLGGAVALVQALLGFDSGDQTAAAATLAWTIAIVLFLLGAIDAWVGSTQRGKDRFARDWITTGVLEALAAVVVLLVPSDYFLGYDLTDKTQPTVHLELTAQVIVVGLLGAALAIIGVYLAIAAVSLIPSRAGKRKEAVEA